MIDIIVAVLCNLIPAFILVCGIISGVKSGIRVSLLNLIAVLSAGVLAYFACPLLSDKLITISLTINDTSIGLLDILIANGISIGTLNSLIYFIAFIIIYLFGLLFCNLIKNVAIINKLKDKTENKARIKRARSINPKAEKIAKKTMTKTLKARFNNSLSWWNRLIAIFVYMIASLLIGFVVLIPYKFIATDLITIDTNKQYLLNGYKYTINGLVETYIPFDFDNWLISATDKKDESPEEPPIDTPCEHIYVEGVCILCGEDEIITIPCEHSYVEGICEFCGDEEVIQQQPEEPSIGEEDGGVVEEETPSVEGEESTQPEEHPVQE